MAYEIKASKNVLKFADPESYIAMPGTLANTGLSADIYGRKIVAAGTALESNSSGTIRKNGDVAKVCTSATGPEAEVLLESEVDVTEGSKPASFLIFGEIDAAALPALPSGSVAPLKAFGFNLHGVYTESVPPVLTFDCVKAIDVGSTKIVSVSPTLTLGNTYMVALNKTLPKVGDDMTGASGWSAYTLGDSIAADNDDIVTLIEVGTGDVVKKAGTDTSVPGTAAPSLTFSAIAGAKVAYTKVASVSPALTGGNSYLIAVEKAVPSLGFDLSADADYSAYTLGDEIFAGEDDEVIIVEVTAAGIVVKAGSDECDVGATPPVLTFVCADHATPASTKIASVDPVVTGANTYMVIVGNSVAIPAVGADLTGVSTWAAYTLDDAIGATNGVKVTLCEVSTGDIVVKAGASTAVVA